jgi:radical SAM enzyme (TIGR01210 family)
MVMRKLRRGRLQLTRDLVFYNNIHGYPDGTHVSTWFQTRGCTWDLLSGGCTMCNYAKGVRLAPDEMLASVRQAFAETGDLDVESRFVYSAGSTLDPREVPPEVRRGIWAILSRTDARKAKTQARPEDVTRELVEEFASGIPGKELSLHLGMESACAWVGRFCVNRSGAPEDFHRAALLLRDSGVRVRATVTLGAAFLSGGEVLADALASTRWAFDHGADEVAFLPVHVKPNTLLADLYSRGRYRPVSLWTLVEVLGKTGPDRWPAVRFFGWFSHYPDRRKIVASPTTCPLCRDRVIRLLGECHHTWSREPLEELLAVDCRCKDLWREDLARVPDGPLAGRVLEAYRALAREHGFEEWWDRHAARLETELRATRPRIEGPSGTGERGPG